MHRIRFPAALRLRAAAVRDRIHAAAVWGRVRAMFPESNGAEDSAKVKERIGALSAQISEAERALAYLAGPGHAPVRAYYERVVKDYDALLNDVNIDEKQRDRACFAKDVALKMLNADVYFKQRVKHFKAELASAQDKPKQKRGLFETLSFIR